MVNIKTQVLVAEDNARTEAASKRATRKLVCARANNARLSHMPAGLSFPDWAAQPFTILLF